MSFTQPSLAKEESEEGRPSNYSSLYLNVCDNTSEGLFIFNIHLRNFDKTFGGSRYSWKRPRSTVICSVIDNSKGKGADTCLCGPLVLNNSLRSGS